MKRRQRSSEEFAAIRLLDVLARARGLKLNEPSDHAMLLDTLTKVVSHVPQNKILVYGTRVDSMFAYVAGALGHCAVIKEEDAGELYSDRADVTIPDFRLLTLESEEFFVEVKNCHKASIEYQYRLTQEYMQGLRNYTDLFNRELKIAIYWSQLGLWTLLSADAFEFDGRYYSLTMAQCMKRNEMQLIGDGMVATVPPIIFRVLPDLDKPRKVSSEDPAEFTIGAVQIFCGGRQVEDPFEQKLVWFLLLYGNWDASEPEAKVEDGELTWMQFVASKDQVEGQDFATLGFLSQMISSQFNVLTAEDGKVVRLAPSYDPDKLGIVIPAGFKGKDLRLWRFTLSPNYE